MFITRCILKILNYDRQCTSTDCNYITITSLTWLSILISVNVSLSFSASTSAKIPTPVMKFDSTFKLFNFVFTLSISARAFEWKKGIVKLFNCPIAHHRTLQWQFLLTSSIGATWSQKHSVTLQVYTFWDYLRSESSGISKHFFLNSS